MDYLVNLNGQILIYDLDDDNQIDIKELRQGLCSCDSELEIVWSQFDLDRISTQDLSSIRGVIPFPHTMQMLTSMVTST